MKGEVIETVSTSGFGIQVNTVELIQLNEIIQFNRKTRASFCFLNKQCQLCSTKRMLTGIVIKVLNYFMIYVNKNIIV